MGIAAWLLAWFRPSRLDVRGDSMAPTLVAGDRVLAGRLGDPRPGDIVTLEHPTRPGYEMVKRISAGPGEMASDGRILGPDEFWVVGDDPMRSTDSRHFGPVPRALLRARVWLLYRPWSRRTLLRSLKA